MRASVNITFKLASFKIEKIALIVTILPLVPTTEIALILS